MEQQSGLSPTARGPCSGTTFELVVIVPISALGSARASRAYFGASPKCFV
jgi:hypothetical protein